MTIGRLIVFRKHVVYIFCPTVMFMTICGIYLKVTFEVQQTETGHFCWENTTTPAFFSFLYVFITVKCSFFKIHFVQFQKLIFP